MPTTNALVRRRPLQLRTHCCGAGRRC